MSIPAFDPSIATDYGTSGQDTARKMAETLNSHSLSITYNEKIRIFTIPGSSQLDKNTIEKIFAEQSYKGWVPEVLDATNAQGEHLVRLICDDSPGSLCIGQIAHLVRFICDDSPGSLCIGQTRVGYAQGAIREQEAVRLVSFIQNDLDVPLSGKTCIDIGCKSGENTIALQNARAQVIGIDPDDTEFGTAVAKGMRPAQLVKATLQKYHSSFPQQKFDVATVFLWNIFLDERESFITTLAKIIKPDGWVIIGYADQRYHEGPFTGVAQAVAKAFMQVEPFAMPGAINRHILKCSQAKE